VWSSVLALALLAALNPLRLGLALLVISRPRPAQNLLAFWVGCLIVSLSDLLVPLMALHFTPMFNSFVHDVGTPGTVASSTVRHIQIGGGVLALSIVVLLTLRFSARQRAHLPTPGANTSTLEPESNTSTATSRLLGRGQDAPMEGGSAIRRLLGRAHNAWENGSLWVAFVIGLVSGPSLEGVVYVLAIIVPSGASTGTQVSAAIAFVVGMLAVVEITLAGYLVTPAKTQAFVQLLHDWARAHRRKVLVAMFAVVGVALVAQGMR
jgi:hypothetical protein